MRGLQRAILRGFAVGSVAASAYAAASCTYSVGALAPFDPGDAALDAAGLDTEAGTAASSCFDTSSDSKNCGACGRDCLGQPCVEALCVPAVLASAQDEPRTLAVDDDGLYWGSGTTAGVYACRPKACPDGPTLIADEGVPVVALTTSKFYLFWSTRSEIHRLAKDGTAVVRVDNGAAAGAVVALAADETSFYFTTTDVLGGVGRCPSAGCPMGNADYLAYDFERPSGLALGPTGFAFFAGAQDRSVVYCSPACGDPPSKLAKILAAGLSEPDTIALDEHAAYFTQGLDSAVAGVARASLSAPFVATTLAVIDTPGPLATDATSVYFVGKADGSIRKVSKGGGPVVILAKGQSAPRAIAVDGARVYFTNAGPNGNVLWVAK